MIKMEFLQDFKEGPVVLVAMDAEGVSELLDALAKSNDVDTSRFNVGNGITLKIALYCKASVEFDALGITWEIPRDRVADITDKARALRAFDGPSHHYVDWDTPADTLVLSKDEYV